MTETTTRSTSRWSRRLIGPFTLRHLVVVGGVLLAVAMLLALLNTPAAPTQPALPVPGSAFYQLGEPTAGLVLGRRAPELEGTINGEAVPLRDLDGALVQLEDRLGSPVWLTFFATWCAPCQEETPALRAAHERYSDAGLQLVAISVQETTPDDVAAYAETYSLPYTIGFDATSAVFAAYQGYGLPTHFFLDGDGILRQIVNGPLTDAQIDEIVKPLLTKSAGSS